MKNSEKYRGRYKEKCDMDMFFIEPEEKFSQSITDIDANDAKHLYYTMLLIRKVELKIEDLYHFDEMKTPIHLYIGQEAIASGVCYSLRKSDYVFSNHRSHGHYIAKGGNLKALIAELYCRETGCSKGRGGSMHLIDPSVGLMGSSSIVGGGIPLAVGAAFATKLRKDDRIAVVFFGDGAIDEGVVYESVNFALYHKLPVLFVCENNFYSVCSPTFNRHISDNIYYRFSGMGLNGYRVDGTDVVEVHTVTRSLVEKIRRGEGPSFIECRAYRWRGHGGAGSDIKLGYRSKEELEYWVNECPVEKFEKNLIKSEILTPRQIEDINVQVQDQIEEAFRFAQASPLPDGKMVLQWLFSEEGK